MNKLTQPLLDEHKELYPHVEAILRTADQIGDSSVAALCPELEEILDFLAGHLRPHARAEEAALYPAVQELLGSPAATRTMARDHVEVGRYIDELTALLAGELTSAQMKPLRRVLYGVYALLVVHFAKEEEVYLPILEQGLTAESARKMFGAMEAAANAARQPA